MNKKLIVIEGLDGSGKATQSELLRATLDEKRIHTRRVSFPDYDSDSSAPVRMYLKGEFGSHPDDVNAYAASSFYAVDRYCSFKKDWSGDYEQGVVIADRYTTSNAIHQCSKLPGEEWDEYLDWLFDHEYNKLGIPAPDTVIYLRVDPEISQKLMTGRYQGHDEKKDIHESDVQYLRRCKDAAEYCAKRLGWNIVECMDGNTIKSIDDIHREIVKITDSAIIEE